MSTIDIRFDREYFFFDPLTSEAVIMKVENLGVSERTRHSVQFKTQNYIQREDQDWQKIQMEDFNKLGLVLIAEYNPEPESKSAVAIAKVKALMEDLGIELEGTDDYEDMLQVIGEHIEDLIYDEKQEDDDDYSYDCTCINYQGEHEENCDSRF